MQNLKNSMKMHTHNLAYNVFLTFMYFSCFDKIKNILTSYLKSDSETIDRMVPFVILILYYILAIGITWLLLFLTDTLKQTVVQLDVTWKDDRQRKRVEIKKSSEGRASRIFTCRLENTPYSKRYSILGYMGICVCIYEPAQTLRFSKVSSVDDKRYYVQNAKKIFIKNGYKVSQNGLRKKQSWDIKFKVDLMDSSANTSNIEFDLVWGLPKHKIRIPRFIQKRALNINGNGFEINYS